MNEIINTNTPEKIEWRQVQLDGLEEIANTGGATSHPEDNPGLADASAEAAEDELKKLVASGEIVLNPDGDGYALHLGTTAIRGLVHRSHGHGLN